MKNQIIKGTFILSLAGIFSRLIGFYYRIFLSGTIGAEGMGLYQMIFPIYNLCLSLAIPGIQTAISKFCASASCISEKLKYLKYGLILSLSISFVITGLLFVFHETVAICIVGDVRCSTLLKIAAISIPFCSLHSCITGYFFGQQQSSAPAFSQLFEQISRVAFVFLFTLFFSEKGTLSPIIAMYGTLIGEITSSIVSVIALFHHGYIEKKKVLKKETQNQSVSKKSFLSKRNSISQKNNSYLKQIFTLSYPLTFSRIITGIIASSEAVLILFCLKKYGLSHTDALSVYGVLTGMAMPFIFFPSTITGAISAMILPSIAEAQSKNNSLLISRTASKVIQYCFSIGIFFAAIFYFDGVSIGTTLFQNSDAGTFISILSWLCPFMYLGSTLGSILNGLGKTNIFFAINLTVSISRIVFIYIFTPMFAIKGYLWGILASQVISAFLLLYFTKKYARFSFDIKACFITPCIQTLIALSCSHILSFLFQDMITNNLLLLAFRLCISGILFIGLLYGNNCSKFF